MPSQDFNLMLKIVSQIYSRADAEPFREPVDWKTLGLFDYPQLIKKPMDLGQIKSRLEKDEYNTLHDAAEDVRLVWQNCKQYNADGSDFYKLAESLSKRFEDKYAKLVKELNLQTPQNGKAAAEPTLDEKRAFAKSLYKISKEELGKVIVDLDKGCPNAITKNSAEDQVEINVDNITPESFQSVMAYVTRCIADSGGNKKKKSGGGSKAKKARTS